MEIYKEEPVTKKHRLEYHNANDIFQEQRPVIKNQKEELKNSESSTTETKIKNILVLELPNEIWLEIMSYLSLEDVLRNVAQVSKRFHKLSQDSNVIRKIEVDPAQFWPKNKEEKFCDEFLGVLKRSLKLRSLSFGFSKDIDNDKSGKKFLEVLPFMNHKFLKEFILKNMNDFFDNDILKYLEKCSLKVLKVEFKPESGNDIIQIIVHPYMGWISSFKLKYLEIFHFSYEIKVNNSSFFKDFLKIFVENLPKLQHLCLNTVLDEDNDEDWDECSKICQAFATEKNIKLEITGGPTFNPK